MKNYVKCILAILFVVTIGVVCYFLLNTQSSSKWYEGKIKPNDNYDVIVVGGEPEGIVAAISAARNGAKTLLLTKEDNPGGLMVYGMLNTIDMNRSKPDGEVVTKGIFSEFYDLIGATESFDVETAKNVFLKLLNNEERLTHLENKCLDKPILEDNKIIGVQTKDGEKYYGNRIIDATPDGDVCAMSGVPYFYGMEDLNIDENMAVTLVFRVGGVDWKELKNDVERYKAETGDKNCGYNKSTVWAFGKWCYDKYKPINDNMKLRGLNIGRQDDNSILINALQIFDVDISNEESIEKAKEEGAKEVDNILKYLKTILNSFKDSYIIGVADELYVRESRHIIGEYILTANDLLENRNFSDKIALGAYPIDIQATNINNNGYVIGVPSQYSIPIRCIIPLKIDNLFIVGKAASYSSVAAGSARVIPVGMVCGESAGIAAVYSIINDISPRELTVNEGKMQELTKILKSEGVYLPEFDIKNKNEDYPGYSQIRKLINMGILNGGYKNDFEFEKETTVGRFYLTLVEGLKRSGDTRYDEDTANRLKKYWGVEELRGIDVATITLDLLGENVDDMSNNEIWENFESKKILGIYSESIEKNTVINKGQMYYIAANVLDH